MTADDTRTLQAKKEKNSAVAKQLEGALKAAMEEKQKTLRPEIQLLNNLLAVNSRTARKQACLRIADTACCTLCMLSTDAASCKARRTLHLLSSCHKLMSMAVQLMNTPQAKEVMAMNNQYFESLVNRMLTGELGVCCVNVENDMYHVMLDVSVSKKPGK